MGFLEFIGWKRKRIPTMIGGISPSSITLQHLSALGCAWAMNGERFDCCEVWYDKDANIIHMRMCDQSLACEVPPHTAYHRSYSMEGTKPDGSEKMVMFMPEILEQPVDRIKWMINTSFSKPLELVKS
jgi:hypothetical protein